LIWIAAGAAFFAAGGTIVSAIFRTGISQATELIHSRASALAVLAVLVLTAAYTVALARHRMSAAASPVTISLALVATALAAVAPVLHDTRWTGLSQRLLWAALLIWLLVACTRPAPGNSQVETGTVESRMLSPR
jgi:hypothetical protein